MTAPEVHTQTEVRVDPAAARTDADSLVGSRREGTFARGESTAGTSAVPGPADAEHPAGSDSLAGNAALAGDSLRTAAGCDSLLQDTTVNTTAWELLGPRFGVEAASEAQPVAWRDTTVQAVFGPASVRVASAPAEGFRGPEPTDNVPFQCFVLLLAATYAVLLYRNMGDIRALLSRAFHDTTSRKWPSEDSGSSGFAHFLNVTVAIGLLFIGLLVAKLGGSAIDGQLPDKISGIAVPLLSLATTLAGGLVFLYQRSVLRAAGAITVTRPFISQLIQLRRTYFSLAVIITVPVLLLLVLCPAESDRIWFRFLILESAITAILYVKESLSLFLSKNFSILHWFLYLCTVELFPISLLWLLISRGEVSIQ